jgi:beta-phosphoglucomutase-like phosphatase (HAD superfamily)
VDRSSVEAPKPEPAAYVYALQALTEMPGDCVAVEDNFGGVQAAVAAGVPCVAFPNTGQGDFSAATQRAGRLDFTELERLTSRRQEAR